MKYIGTNAIDIYGEELRRRDMPLEEYNNAGISTDVKQPDYIDAVIKPVEPPKEDDVVGKHFNLQLPRYNMNMNVNRGTSGNGNDGWLAPQVPYIVITRPELLVNTDTYGHYYGFPSDATTQLNTLTGFTKVGDIHLDNIGCNNTEESLLDNNLRSGVIIRNWTVSKPSIFTLYHNNSDVNVIGKELRTLRTFSVVRLKKSTSMTNPTFIVTDIDDIVGSINYLYYPGFDRYYIVNDIVSVRDNLWAIDCRVDVLETYKGQLANQTAVIERQEFNYNMYINDSALRAYSKPYTVTLPFPKNFNMFGYSRVIVGLGAAPEESHE